MENYQASLDAAFHSLADPTRRAVISRLTRGPAAVSELAAPFEMGLPSFLKHLKILENDGLISSEKVGRVRTCRVNAERLSAAETWLAEQRAIWQGRADRLADYVETQMSKGPDNAD
jgi:DNA-binding transcriptional ArsR family regulator